MSEKTEIFLAKIIAAIIIFLCCIEISEASDKIETLFMKYNRKQAVRIAYFVREAGKKYDIEPEIIASIIVVESGVRPHVISRGGDYGLMQVRYKVHKDKVKSANHLLDPKTNIFIGTRIFKQYYEQKKDLRKALIRYSGGNKKMAAKVLKVLINAFNKK